jgi:M6 family metalloprotease-like protein
MITLKQPNGVEFIGRMWGDEFIWWTETEDGYRFIETGNGWYYYAALDQNGEYTPTNYKVGIDSPPASSYQLERTQSRLDEIKEQIEQFNEQIELNRQWFEQKQAEAQGQPVTLKIGIILIEFTDTTHYKSPPPPVGNRPNGYFASDFDSMMFSYNYWYDTTGATPHPENEKIFGSFRDYWYQMSKGKLKITGKVVNPDTTGDGVPEWIMADTTRPYYADPTIFSWGHDTLANEAIYKAKQYGYITDTAGPKYYDKLVVVYAQFARTSGALMVHAEDIGGKFIILAERSGPNLFGGLYNEKSFTHIGIYLHELAHTFGLYDEYWDGFGEDGFTDILNFCLMSYGIYNGPDRKGACPATLSPWYRLEYSWLPQPTIIDSNQVNFLIEYDYANPKLYRINPIDASGNMHYLFEVRHREGFDLYVPAPPETFPNDQPGTLIVWQHEIESVNPSTSNPYYDRIRIKPADYSLFFSPPQTQLNDFFPSEGYQNYQCLNDTTLPAASLGDRDDEQFPYFIRPAHFELEGIHKLQDNNTQINEINLNHAIVKNHISGNWQTVSVGAILSNYSSSSIFPTAIPPVYEFIPGQGYVVRTTLANGPGYWVKFGSAQSLAHAGLILDSINIRVSRGWNLIGSISDKVPKRNICTEPPGIIISMYYYDGGYHYLTNSDSLKPGRGYWLNSTSTGNIILLRNYNCPENEGIDLSGMDKFIVTDSEGRTQDLYIANVDIDTTITEVDRSLPPPLPEIDFDARFNYGEFIKAVSVDSGEVNLEIDVQTNAYPVILSWEINPANGIEYSFLSDSGFGKISSLNNINRKLNIDENSKGKIRLFGRISNSVNTGLPEKFELLQNYPNPFNPVTKIKFTVPKEIRVSLTVYNILGEKVKELKNELMKPGYYEVNFDASNLASGIYLYRIQAGDPSSSSGQGFVNSKKMLLLK